MKYTFNILMYLAVIINSVFADTIIFKNGNNYECTVVSYNNGVFIVEINGKINNAPVSNIDQIIFSESIKKIIPDASLAPNSTQQSANSINGKQSISGSIDSLSTSTKFKGTSCHVSCTYSIRTPLQSIKTPIVYLAICYKSGSDIKRLIELRSGPPSPINEWRKASAGTIASDSSSQKEVTSADYRRASFDGQAFTGSPITVLAVYAQLWVNGVMVAERFPSQRDLLSANLPADWYIKGKYPDKFQY